MRSSQAAERYAKSLIDLAKEQGAMEDIKSDMEGILLTIDGSQDLAMMLQSPIIKPDAKTRVLEALFGKTAHKISLSFLKLITSKGREAILDQIAEAYLRLYRIEKGIVRAEVISAKPLTDDVRNSLKKALANTGASIELSERVDPAILGGLRVKVGDQLIDASVRRKLNELRIELTQ